MPDLMTLSHRQVEALLGLSRNSYNWIHGPSTDSTLKALRRMGLVNLSWDDSVAGYMFGSQPCWSITDAGRKRILAIQGTLTEEPEQQFNPSPGRHEPGKSDSDRLAEQLETIARLEKELEESEKRGSELAASYCDGVVGDEYGHTYCRYKAERDAALARPSTAIATAPTYQFQSREIGESDWTPCDFSRYLYCSKSPEMDTRVVEVTSQTSQAQSEQAEAERPEVVGYLGRRIGMYEPGFHRSAEDAGYPGPGRKALIDLEQHDSIVEELRAERDAALARVAELEGKLTDWVREGFRLNEALTVAKSRYGAPEGYALIPVRETEAMHDAVMALLYNGVARADTQKLLDAYINAATSKESV